MKRSIQGSARSGGADHGEVRRNGSRPVAARLEARVRSFRRAARGSGKDELFGIAWIGNDDHGRRWSAKRSAPSHSDGVRRKKRKSRGFAAELRNLPAAVHGGRVSPISPSLACSPDKLSARSLACPERAPRRIERVLEPLVGAHGGMIVEVDVQYDGPSRKYRTVAGEAPFVRVLDEVLPSARARAHCSASLRSKMIEPVFMKTRGVVLVSPQ